MAGALTRYWENQYAGVVGDFQRKVEKYPITATQEEWDKLGLAGKAEYCTFEVYLDAHPGAKQADYEALITAMHGKDQVAAIAALNALAVCVNFEIYKAAIEEQIRITLTAVKQSLLDVKTHMLDVLQNNITEITKNDYKNDFDLVISQTDAKIAQIGK